MMTLYTDREGGSVIVCAEHAKRMPPVDGDRIMAEPADDDVSCELCVAEYRKARRTSEAV